MKGHVRIMMASVLPMPKSHIAESPASEMAAEDDLNLAIVNLG